MRWKLKEGVVCLAAAAARAIRRVISKAFSDLAFE